MIQHYPIAENISKVQSDDIIVSEYHTPDKAKQIVRDVCGLKLTRPAAKGGFLIEEAEPWEPQDVGLI